MEIRKREAESTESELETDFISLKKTFRGANNMSSALSPSLSTPTLLAHLSTGVSLQIPRPVSPESTCQPSEYALSLPRFWAIRLHWLQTFLKLSKNLESTGRRILVLGHEKAPCRGPRRRPFNKRTTLSKRHVQCGLV